VVLGEAGSSGVEEAHPEGYSALGKPPGNRRSRGCFWADRLVVEGVGERDPPLQREDRAALLRLHEEPQRLVDEGSLRPDPGEPGGLPDEVVVEHDVGPHCYTSKYIQAGV